MKFATLARIAPALALYSCAAPKAIIVELPPASQHDPGAVPPEISEPEFPTLPDDGIRLPDMLAMPGDNEFRATAPTTPKAGSDSNAVIARPPTDPPPRPKPKKTDPE